MPDGLYIHIPFCQRRCFYCDFNTYEGLDGLIPVYQEALLKDMGLAREQAGAGPLKSIFFGGGTPSLLPPAFVGQLIRKASEVFGLSADVEVTLEANPGTVDFDKFSAYLGEGVNRLSMGFQAAQDRHLGALGRVHSAEDSTRAWGLARRAGFKNMSLDLMFGLPGQSLKEWRQSLAWALQFEPEHLSFYGLSVEKGTRFYHLQQAGQLLLPSEEVQAEMYEEGISTLERHGLQHYEISNFAKRGFRSVHNQLYWRNRPTLGIGAGAWSFLNGERFSRTKSPQEYIQKLEKGSVPREETESLQGRQARGEAAYLGLRLIEGIDLKLWQAETGRSWFEDFEKETKSLCKKGLLESDGQFVKLSKQGIPLANEVFQEFVGIL